MAEFDQIRRQLRDARTQRDAAAQGVADARERLERIDAQQAQLDRVFNPENPAHAGARERLERERGEAKQALGRFEERRASAIADEAGLLPEFAVFTDPRQGIERLNDATPILMMPVRLETRFRTAAVPGAAGVNQLWVRIYPDDCWIDTFDPSLSESELLNAKTYWTSIWQAGGIEDQERAAWMALATGHGSGRAAWIVQAFQPVNLPSKPSKPLPQDVILTIATDTPLAAPEEAPTIAFWRAVWLADGDVDQIAAAGTAFEAAVGTARAVEIAEQYVPVNFSEPLQAGATKQTVNLAVAFVVFPIVDPKQQAWSRAPKAAILPDRFVFIGYDTETDPTPTIGMGLPVPSPLITGPDPSAPEAEQIARDADGNIVMPDELKWLADFDRAVDVGMGLRINLSPTQAARGFKRVLVVGLRLNADQQAAQAELETLLRHHAFSRGGLAVVPQGTPTNNTEDAGSGFGRLDKPDESFEDRKAPLFTPQSDWLDKRDGQWLAEWLGIDPATLHHTHHAESTDQLTARAMNIALWPATLGYWMESMMAPVFTPDGIDATRDFFTRYVLGAGACPAIRIGAQPYGVLPATAISRMAWLNQRLPGDDRRIDFDRTLPFLRRLYPILLAIDTDFRAKIGEVSFVGKPGDPHELLLDVVGLHPASVEWSQRYAESLKTLFNRLSLQGFGGAITKIILAARRQAARTRLTGLGYGAEADPPILDLIFNGRHNLLKGGVVDDVPLSETATIRTYTADGRTYVQWLIDAANTSLDAIYAQQGFTDNKLPTALLYLFLRHALQLGYHEVGVRLHELAGLYDPVKARNARIDDPFLHVRNHQLVSESRYQPLYAMEPAITGSPTIAVHQHIAAQLPTLVVARTLREQVDAMERLKLQSTARLERAFADHIDCCAYRLDAWLLGIVTCQLGLMRNVHDGVAAPARQGVYLGAYAWLEDLTPDHRVLAPVRLTDPELIERFETPGQPPLVRDSQNQGYVHAPSLNHAVAAAVLRNGYISNSSPANRQTMAVNLTSERVRTALAMIEGIRAGQGLADLLGYQFERGLHDRHGLAEVDKFIFKLRKEFPIRADRLQSTKTEEGVPIEAIEARNVIDGLRLVEHIQSSGNRQYPFGKTSLPAASAAEADAINAEVDRLLESHDAVADLALAEGVYQAVLGNYDRVASTYDAYARGNFPPEPDVVRTPSNGIGLTHRVTLHLAAGASPNVSPIPGLPMTPRAQGEPALNQWLAGVLPPLEEIGCLVDLREAATGTIVVREVTLDQLELQPADLVAIARDDPRQEMDELDDRIVRFAVLNFGPRPDVMPAIRYRDTDTAEFSVFECLSLLRALRALTMKSRPLAATDLTLMNEATPEQDQQAFVDKQRLELVQTAMQSLRNDLAAFKAAIDGPLGDLANRRGEILADVDSYVTTIANLLARAATFAVPQSGWGFAYDFRRRTFAAMLQQSADLVVRWDERIAEFNARLADATAATTDEAKFEFLAQAERAISTIPTTPLPATPALYEANLTGVKLPAFVATRGQFAAIQNTTRTSVSLLLADVQGLLPIADFDFVEFTLTAHEDEMVRFTEDVSGLATVMLKELDRRLAGCAARFTEHDESAGAAARVRALDQAARMLLGESFRVVPELTLPAAQGDEIDNALAAAGPGGNLFEYLKNPPEPERDPDDFPVDTWLHGVARVRDKLHAWERMMALASAVGRPEPGLTALQLPFVPDDRWLGLEFPPQYPLDVDRLLYTAHFSTPFNKHARQCGLLIDEWTEIIPESSVDTGITFHHDRPNCEAPQAMLLVTPAEFRGAWRWTDLVDALNETLDLAKRRAIEPRHIDATPYAPFLPAAVVATQVHQLTIAADLAFNNKIAIATTT